MRLFTAFLTASNGIHVTLTSSQPHFSTFPATFKAFNPFQLPLVVFATEVQSSKTLNALAAALHDISEGKTLDYVIEWHHVSNLPTSSQSTLCRCLPFPLHRSQSPFQASICVWKSRTTWPSTQAKSAFSSIESWMSDDYLERRTVSTMADSLRNEILRE